MKKAAFAITIVLCLTATSAWSQTSDEAWSSGYGQGISEAMVTQGSGNEIYVACSEDSDNPSSISFTLTGRPPAQNSDIILTFDHKNPMPIGVDEHGAITSFCRVCAENFDYVIKNLKEQSTVHVLFQDGREGTFTLKGAAKAIGTCTAGFYL